MQYCFAEDFVHPIVPAKLTVECLIKEGERIREGWLVPSDKTCDIKFPIRNFIPRFVSSKNYATNFGLQWKRHAKTQLDSYNGATYSRDRLLRTTNWPTNIEGYKILEAGSGAGRFTEILLRTKATVFSFDYSEAVEANFANNGMAKNLCLFQASIYEIPLPKASFDKVLCIGVLQHTSDVKKSFMCLAELVRPGGELVVDFYPANLRGLLHWKYLLRPITKRISPVRLYSFTE